LYHCMANLTVYLLKVSNSRRVDRHLRYRGELRSTSYEVASSTYWTLHVDLGEFRREYSAEVVEAEQRVVLGGGGAAVGCTDAAHAQALLAPLQVISGMAAQRFMSNDFRASCRDFATVGRCRLDR